MRGRQWRVFFLNMSVFVLGFLTTLIVYLHLVPWVVIVVLIHPSCMHAFPKQSGRQCGFTVFSKTNESGSSGQDVKRHHEW